jgi:hypothetical protein
MNRQLSPRFAAGAAFLLTAALTLSGCASSATHPADAAAVATEIPLHSLGGPFVTADVEIAGTMRAFAIDTGGGLTTVTPETARLAGCTPAGRFTGFRAVGERLDVPRCASIPMRLGLLQLSPEAGILDIASLGLKGVDGVIALQTLEGQAFTLDISGRRLVLETPESLALRVQEMRELSVRESRQSGGASLDLFVEVTAPSGNLWMELDSGNAGPVLLGPHVAQQLGVEIPKDRPGKVTLDIRGLGPTEVEAIQRDVIYDGLLYSRLFTGRLVTFDLKAKRVWMSDLLAQQTTE